MFLLFETDWRNIRRYYHSLLDLEDEECIVFLKSRSECLGEANRVVFNRLFARDDDILQIFERFQISKLVINGQRIPDLRMSFLAKTAGLEVVYVQHGNHAVFMKRTSRFLFANLTKLASYIWDLGCLARQTKSISFAVRLFLVHAIGWDRKFYRDMVEFKPDEAFYFSPYAKAWHDEYYFDTPLRFRYVGYPDLAKYRAEKLAEGTVVYCYQTLVEDGRVDKREFVSAVDDLAEWCVSANRSLIVVPHPRWDFNILRSLVTSRPNIVIWKNVDSLPLGSLVVGHTSGLLPWWGHHKCCVVSLILKGLSIPEFISSWCPSVASCSELNELSHTIDIPKLEYYFPPYFEKGEL